MAFVELREEGNWTIQGVLTASAEGAPVSRPMVKWVAGIAPESFVVVEATVQKPLEPVKSCRVAQYELHVTKCFILAAAPTVLGMTLTTSNRAVTNFSDEPEAASVESAVEKLSVADSSSGANIPAASMLTHLNNIVMHKRSPVQQAIADIRAEVKELFRSYLRSHGFKEFEAPCLIGAASEGGANVFRLPYFDKEAYLVRFILCMAGYGIILLDLERGGKAWECVKANICYCIRLNHPSFTSRWKSQAVGNASSVLVLSSEQNCPTRRGT